MASSDINETTVQEFLASAAGASPEEIAEVAAQMEAMVRRGERCQDPRGGWVSLATMAETARRLRAECGRPCVA